MFTFFTVPHDRVNSGNHSVDASAEIYGTRGPLGTAVHRPIKKVSSIGKEDPGVKSKRSAIIVFGQGMYAGAWLMGGDPKRAFFLMSGTGLTEVWNFRLMSTGKDDKTPQRGDLGR